MKKNIIFLGLLALVISFAGCNKDADNTVKSDPLLGSESYLKIEYNQALQYNTILVDRFNTPGMTWNDPVCKMNDSLYHISDTAFTMHMKGYYLQMMTNAGMGSNGMMTGGMMGNGGSGGMMCNMDSVIMRMNGMMNMTTFKMDSMMFLQTQYCPRMGNLNNTVHGYLNSMQAMRKVHQALHKHI